MATIPLRDSKRSGRRRVGISIAEIGPNELTSPGTPSQIAPSPLLLVVAEMVLNFVATMPSLFVLNLRSSGRSGPAQPLQNVLHFLIRHGTAKLDHRTMRRRVVAPFAVVMLQSATKMVIFRYTVPSERSGMRSIIPSTVFMLNVNLNLF